MCHYIYILLFMNKYIDYKIKIKLLFSIFLTIQLDITIALTSSRIEYIIKYEKNNRFKSFLFENRVNKQNSQTISYIQVWVKRNK